ncbi:hypothetical protein, partial [Microvirga makkahensis]|uniref:hypothetical protein n=1 Tax=Microvirga makkahensis TaxID=1128670 RepID=UPI00197B8BC4
EDRSGVLTKSIDQVDVYSIRPKDRRKDTAAYASSSFFTCQRAKNTPHQRRPASIPQRTPPEAATPWPPSMKVYLAKPDPNVNNNYEVFCGSSSSPTGIQYSRRASWPAEMLLSLRLL